MGEDHPPLPAKATLTEIMLEVLQIESALLAAEGELSPMVEQWLDQVHERLATKADSYKLMMDRFDATASVLRKNAEEMTRMARAVDNTSERLRNRIKEVMELTQRTEIEGSQFRFKLSPSAPRIIIHEHELPDAFKKQTIITEVDKELVKAAVRDKVQVAGVELKPVYALRISVNKGN